MTSLSQFWIELGRTARVGLIAGSLLIVGLMIALAVWIYRPDYQVLFADVAPRDAAAMTAELDKMKTPYELGENGTAILVPRELVYKTRLALMGKDVPLHGAVGFEVFNNADFGMTEFVQKVNYLRAIQGELTRTILSIDDIQSARVHLAIPDQGLFKKAVTKPKASVTLATKQGRTISAEQVAGIQRLVAASVPDIVSGDVTVLDQHGVALTRVSGDDDAGASTGAQLDAKRSTEDYLVKKVAAVLDRTFGQGETIASVDVALNLDRSKLTTEEVLPAKDASSEGGPTGVVVRERLSSRDSDGAALTGGAKQASGGTTSTESDYQVGRRVEQVASSGGSIRRMTISVVVKQNLSPDQLEKLKEVVSMAVGFNATRGDAIVVNSMDNLANPVIRAPMGALADDAAVPPAARKAADPASLQVVVWILLALLVCAVLAALVLAVRRRAQPARPLLDDAAREQKLLEIRQWIAGPSGAEQSEGALK